MNDIETQPINVNVLMTSGDEDEWVGVSVEVSPDGQVLVFDGETGILSAVYAAGMWMRLEYKP